MSERSPRISVIERDYILGLLPEGSSSMRVLEDGQMDELCDKYRPDKFYRPKGRAAAISYIGPDEKEHIDVIGFPGNL